MLVSLFAFAAVAEGSGTIRKLRVDVLSNSKLSFGETALLSLSEYVIDCEDDTVEISDITWTYDPENGEDGDYAMEDGELFHAGSYHMGITFLDPNDSLPRGADNSLEITVGNWTEVSGDWTLNFSEGDEKRFISPEFEIAPLSGSCGEDASWKFDPKLGKLHITGSGPIEDHSSPDVPWAAYKEKIKRVVIGDEITRIGDSAFESCFNLVSVSMPSALTEIGSYAFSDCEALQSISLPKGLTVIGQEAFSGCEVLSAVKLPKKLKTIGDSAFSECDALTEIVIPDSVETVGDSAFSDCKGLKKASLPFHLAPLDEKEVFEGCTAASVKFSLNGASVDNVRKLTYTGKELVQKPVVGDASVVILKKKYYTVSYKDNVNAGTAVMTITGKGRYEGTLTASFKILRVNLKKNEDVKVADIPNMKYMDEPAKPDVTVTYLGETLTRGTDYTVKYQNNNAIGTATAEIRGKGNFTGTLKKTFKLTKYSEEERKTIRVAEVTGLDSCVYTGSKQRPEIKVSIEETELKKGTDYKVTYKNNKKIGTAKVVIRGIGEYKGSRTETFSIVPRGTKLKKPKATKKTIRVRWVRLNSSISGYQIQYSTDKTFKTGAKAKRIGGADTGEYTIKKLKRKTTYYVRIRTYKKVGKKRYYSAWSNAKKAVTG